MDVNSLILQLKASGLNVDASPLERVLSSISQTLLQHETIVCSLPQIEAAQGDLRKEISRLKLALDSFKRVEADTADFQDESKAAEPSSDAVPGNEENHSSYGVRREDIEPVHKRHAENVSNANDKVLREIKLAIRKLQQDRDEGLVDSIELDESIKKLKKSLFEIQQKLSSAASTEQLTTLQQSLVTKYGQMEQHIQEFKTSFRKEVDGNISHEINYLFNDLEDAMKQHQTKLEQRVSTCAKEYDVAAFREGIESDVEALARKTSFLDDAAKAQGKTLVSLQKNNAIMMLQRHYTNWKKNALKTGLSRWKLVVKQQIEYEQGKASQKRLIRKIVTNIMSRRKRFGFDKWIKYRDWNRKVEAQKLKASTLICERLGLYLAAPKTMAFNRWRRLTLMDKMKTAREADELVLGEETSDESTSSAIATDIVKREQAPLDLNGFLQSFGGDLKGSLHALAQEIENIKSSDLASLRQDMNTENQRVMSTIDTTMNEAIQRVNDTAETFQETVKERVDNCTNDLPVVHAKLQELSGLLQSSEAHLANVEEDHAKRIDTLFAQDEQLDSRLTTVEDQTNTNTQQLTILFEGQTKSTEAIQQLHDIIATNEERREEDRGLFQQALDHFGDELLKTKITLGHTQVRCETLEKQLAEAQTELSHFQHACQHENERIQRQIHHPGIPRPSLDRIVNVGHAYETLAKEKNYVTGINVMAVLRTTVTSKMKTTSEKTRHEEEVDVPSEIVAFAHDYAHWIAYQADHETLLSLIAGGNLEDQVYAEDDMLSRRKDLISESKEELAALLEKASIYPTTADPSATSRGMGLRHEARAIFLARLVDATNAALSKHDQILLPAATRLGRQRPLSANVTVCVACDRPMRRKMNRNHSASKEADAEKKSSKPIQEAEDEAKDVSGVLEVRPGTTPNIGVKQSGSEDIPRSSSIGQVIKSSRLAEALKENSDPYHQNANELVLR